jgi:hypothetical protein
MTARPQEAGGSIRRAATVFVASIVLAAPLGVAMSVGYRALYAAEAWAVGSPYSSEDLEFLQPAEILRSVIWTYAVCAVPMFATAAALAMRTWVRGWFGYVFGYVYAAMVAGASMALYLTAAAYVFRHARVAVVRVDTVIDGIWYAVLVSLVCTALLRWSGLIKSGGHGFRDGAR